MDTGWRLLRARPRPKSGSECDPKVSPYPVSQRRVLPSRYLAEQAEKKALEAAKNPPPAAPAEDPEPAGADDEGEEANRRLTNAMSSAGPETDLHTGYMLKEGGGYKSWKKRYFVLTRTAVAYYTDQVRLPQGCSPSAPAHLTVLQTRTKSQLKGGLLLEHVSAVKPAEQFDTKKPNVICIETKDRRYLFQAASQEERDVWISKVCSPQTTFPLLRKTPFKLNLCLSSD